VDEAPSPLEEAIGGEAIERYQAALTKLPESDRDAIVGRLELGLSYDELAELLGKPSPDAARKSRSTSARAAGRRNEAWPMTNH
jgi:RNA polymerase sigma-70 factor (ECF subfamily)